MRSDAGGACQRLLKDAGCSTCDIRGKCGGGHRLSAYAERPPFGSRDRLGPITTVSLMWAAFVVAFALAVIMLVIFGVGERGTAIALRATARWSFLLFWLAYAGGAIAWLCRPRFSGLARHGRDLGLAYASAQLIHVGLVLWIIHIATGPSGAMLFFWIGIFCTYLLALFSLPPASGRSRAASLAHSPHDCAGVHRHRLHRRLCHAAPARARQASVELTTICTHAC